MEQLTIGERIALAQELLDSVAAEQVRAPLSEAKKRKLDRRLAELDSDPTAVVPWVEVEAEALARFSR